MHVRIRTSAAALLVLVANSLPLSSHAQEPGRITGRVTDAATARPLLAAQVFIPPTGLGNLTDQDGRFLILNVPPGEHTVTVQLVGYRQFQETVTVAAGQTLVVNAALTQTAIQLEEIVVTGAGVAMERRRLGNTIATIDASRLENAPVTDLSQMLQGREPGVTALPSSGFTGEGARIRIRGSSSLSQSNEPVVYVDGIRIDNSGMARSTGGQASVSRLDDIPPDAIERIEILKGAAAATLYGTEASNGVIQIFTKKGRAGAPRFTFQTDLSAIDVPTNRMDPLADFPRSQADVDRIQTRWGRNLQLYEVFEEDLLPEYFQTGVQQVYSASVTGGGNLITYFVSGRFQHEDGPLGFERYYDRVLAENPALREAAPPNPDFPAAPDRNQRFQTSANLTIQPHEQVRIGVNTMYAEVQHESPQTSNNIYGLFSSALMSQIRLASPTNLSGSSSFITTREAQYQRNEDNTKRFLGSLNTNYAPFPSVRLDATVGVDFTSESAWFFRPFRWAIDGFTTVSPEGTRSITEVRSHVLTGDFKGSWETTLGEDVTNTFLAGTQSFLRQRTSKGGTGTRFPGPGLEVAGAGADQSVTESWVRNTQVGGYLQNMTGWKDWVFLTLGGRFDANSAFGSEFSTVFYPKASISYIPTTAFDWYNPTFSTIRLRAAIGRSGLQPDVFDKFTTYVPYPSIEGPGVRPSNLGNDELKPEVATEFELGAELGLFEDRASVDVTWWSRDVSDAIIQRQYAPSGGFTATQATNIGKLEASGLDVTARGSVVQRPNLSLSVFAGGAYIKETVVDLGGAPPQKTGGSYSRYRNFLVEGWAPGAFFGAKVADMDVPLNLFTPNPDGSCVTPTREQALQYFSSPRDPSEFKPLVVGNSDFDTPTAAPASHNCGEGSLLTYLGKPSPDWQGSFGFNLGFLGNFELNSLFEFKAGNFAVHDLSGEFRRASPTIGRNIGRARELEATMMNPASTAEQRLTAAIEWAREYEGLAPLDGLNSITPADFIRWRELSLTYRVPVSVVDRLGLASAVVNLGARNMGLWIHSAYPGMDPEGNVLGRCNTGPSSGLNCNFLDGTEGWGIPVPRRYTISTRVSF